MTCIVGIVGIHSIQKRLEAVQIKEVFLLALAWLFSDYLNFWQGDFLFVEASLRRKLKQFNLRDPDVERLAGSGGRSREILYLLLRNHINSGKRTQHLQMRETASSLARNNPAQ